MEEFLWSEDRNWSVVDISSVLSESVDWLYDRDTPGSQAAAGVQRVTLADTTARAASEAIEIGGMSTASHPFASPSYCSGKLKYQQLR